MPEPTMSDDELGVWRTIQALNHAWTSGRVDELEAYFHEDMVAVTPTERERLEGREACIAAWRRFVETATIRRWRELEPKVRLFGDAAIVSYYYELECDLHGQRTTLAGRDLFFMVKEEGRWLAVADQFSGYPQGSGA